jgi:histidyl-tRNA synthetase
MIQLKNTRVQSTASLIERAIRTAEYYGFIPLEVAFARGRVTLPPQKTDAMIFARRDERALLQGARQSLAAAHPGEIALVWRVVKNPSGTRSPVPSQTLELHILGAHASIAEALLIMVTSAIADEIGVQRRTLSLNSIGSIESSNRFVRDVGAFLRKHLDSISPTLRPRAASDPLGTLIQLFEKGHPAMARAPQSVEYLTEDERRRFWELLEYLEMASVPYELNAAVLGSRDFWAHTLFEMSTNDEGTGARIAFANGGRYDPLASRLVGHPTTAALATFTCEIRGKSRVQPIRRSAPVLYFAHLGPEARRRALPLLEILRREGVPIEQSLMYDRLQQQMERAKSTKVSHLLIMGHKEAVEGTVLVREVATNSQEAIPIPELMGYLRRQRVHA